MKLPKYYMRALILSLVSLTAACSSVQQAGSPAINSINASIGQSISADEALSKSIPIAVPNNVSQALLPTLAFPSTKSVQSASQKFDVTVNNVPAQIFFMQLVTGTPYNMMVSPDVTGNITLNLKQVTIQQAMAAVHDLYGYQYQVTPYGYQVYPFGLETKIFTVNYLDVTRDGSTHVTVGSNSMTSSNTNTPTMASGTSGSGTGTGGSTGSGSTTTSINTTNKSDVWKKISDTLNLIVGSQDGRQVVIDSDAGVIMVKADPKQLKLVAEYLDSVQSAVVRQVIIDAKILEVTLNNGFQSGIDWTILGFSQTGATNTSGTASGFPNINPFTPMSGTTITGGHFSTVINLLSTEGNVQVLSSPRISTLNNQAAVIKVGQDEFFVTNVSSTTAPSSGTTPSTTASITLTPFFSGIALSVTPQISGNDTVILHIHPIVSDVTSQTKTFTVYGQNQVLPLALSASRETDSIVMAKNKQVVVIGGLMQNKTEEDLASTPFISKVPFFGALFRNTEQAGKKSELVILLQPTIVDNHEMVKALQEEQGRYQDLNRGYHFSDQGSTFGNMGETQ